MIDPDGVEWVTVPEAARRARVRESTIYVWKSRGTVRGHRIGRTLHVAWPDIATAEHAWRTRATTTRKAAP